MRKLCFLFIMIALACLVKGQTNSAIPTPQQETGLTAGAFRYDGHSRQLIYYNHVVITNAQGRLSCERLTIDLPPEGAFDSHPTNAVAETNLDIVYVDTKGVTNYLTADRGVYAYSIMNGTTNETFTFTPNPVYKNARVWMTGTLMVYDNITGNLTGTGMKAQSVMSAGTNGGMFNLMK